MLFGLVLTFITCTMSQILEPTLFKIGIDPTIVLTFRRNIFKFIIIYYQRVNIVKITDWQKLLDLKISWASI